MARQKILCEEAPFYIKNLLYVHHRARYWYHTEAMIECMEPYLEQFHSLKDASSQFHMSESSKKVSEDLKKQLTLVKQKKQKCEPTWNNLAIPV